MTDYDKYLKYKMKYLNLKNKLIGKGEEQEKLSKKILLMFLGGTPSEENIITHYENMNKSFITKDNFHIVIHPLNLEKFKINDRFANIFNKKNIYIVDETHHLLTGWATKSLVYATLLMMQFANINNSGEPFDKYILLSSACAPLYRFDIIYDVLKEDNLSWLNTSSTKSEIEEKDFYPELYPEENTPAKKKDDMPFLGSQWMILDKQHADFLFPDNKYSNTYKKNSYYATCVKKGNSINSGKIEINRISDKQDELIYFLDKYEDCEGSDESFFCNYIMLKIYQKFKAKKKIDDTYTYRTEIYQNIKYNYLTPILQNLRKFDINIIDELNEIDKKNLEDIKYEYPISIGDIINVNKIIYDYPVQFNGRCDIDIIKNDKISYTIRNININYFELGIEENPDEPLLLNQSTYCDWFAFNIDPSNFIRNFSMKNGFDIKEYLNDKSLYDSDINIYEKIKEYVKDYDVCEDCECNDYKRKGKNFYDNVLNTVSHPVEYSCWTFLNVVNVFLLGLYFNCSLVPPNEDLINKANKKTLSYRENYEAYKKIISSIFGISIVEFDTKSPASATKVFNLIYKKIRENPSVLDLKIGTPITPNVLLGAITQGSLFIRKCLNTSMIETYSNVLNKINYIFDSKPNLLIKQALREEEISEITPWPNIKEWEKRKS